MSKKHIETEYKFLIQMPSEDFLNNCPKKIDIEQTYLYPKNRDMRRVRKSTSDNGTKFVYCEKQTISNASRYEYEKILTEKEYTDFLAEKEENTSTIYKTRYVFDKNGFTYEIDIYDFCKNTAIMEVEVETENTIVPIPDIINVIENVTNKVEYSNQALAKSIPKKLLI